MATTPSNNVDWRKFCEEEEKSAFTRKSTKLQPSPPWLVNNNYQVGGKHVPLPCLLVKKSALVQVASEYQVLWKTQRKWMMLFLSFFFVWQSLVRSFVRSFVARCFRSSLIGTRSRRSRKNVRSNITTLTRTQTFKTAVRTFDGG